MAVSHIGSLVLAFAIESAPTRPEPPQRAEYQRASPAYLRKDQEIGALDEQLAAVGRAPERIRERSRRLQFMPSYHRR